MVLFKSKMFLFLTSTHFDVEWLVAGVKDNAGLYILKEIFYCVGHIFNILGYWSLNWAGGPCWTIFISGSKVQTGNEMSTHPGLGGDETHLNWTQKKKNQTWKHSLNLFMLKWRDLQDLTGFVYALGRCSSSVLYHVFVFTRPTWSLQILLQPFYERRRW